MLTLPSPHPAPFPGSRPWDFSLPLPPPLARALLWATCWLSHHSEISGPSSWPEVGGGVGSGSLPPPAEELAEHSQTDSTSLSWLFPPSTQTLQQLRCPRCPIATHLALHALLLVAGNPVLLPWPQLLGRLPTDSGHPHAQSLLPTARRPCQVWGSRSCCSASSDGPDTKVHVRPRHRVWATERMLKPQIMWNI